MIREENLIVSVVIPTYNRKSRLLSLLKNLSQVSYSLFEVIIVDSGDDLNEQDFSQFEELNIIYLRSAKSVCIQRNKGIREAKGEWIFLCDDDIEVPNEYLITLDNYIREHKSAGAVSGIILQKENNQWIEQYPIKSFIGLWWRYIFHLGIWGQIEISKKNFVAHHLETYYQNKGNHISKAGWPVIVDFSGEFFTTPIYGLGASLVRKEWLVNSMYDELLDSHGIGDNYGLALGFPGQIHIVRSAQVYHHEEMKNRLKESEQYFRRCLALHYFISTRESFRFTNKLWFYWSMVGNALYFLLTLNRKFFTSCNVLFITVSGLNPLLKKKRHAQFTLAKI